MLSHLMTSNCCNCVESRSVDQRAEHVIAVVDVFIKIYKKSSTQSKNSVQGVLLRCKKKKKKKGKKVSLWCSSVWLASTLVSSTSLVNKVKSSTFDHYILAKDVKLSAILSVSVMRSKYLAAIIIGWKKNIPSRASLIYTAMYTLT